MSILIGVQHSDEHCISVALVSQGLSRVTSMLSSVSHFNQG